MFTGIIEERGIITDIKNSVDAAVLTIRAEKIMEKLHVGDSIAINGICLTVTAFTQEYFQADVMHETLNRSTIRTFRRGEPVNLERAMAADGRFGGHIVAGHIDGTGTIVKIRRDAIAVWVTISAGPEILKYIIEKGSVAVDGISLTVAAVEADSFQVSVIPHTWEATCLCRRKKGDLVNLENDCIGKYVEKLLRYRGEVSQQEKEQQVNETFLMEHGFL